jgi:mRNA interferase MazF
MAIQFHPRAGQVLMCDFTGFQIPEMVKTRPVVVVSPRLPYRSYIVAIVPLSTTEPKHNLPYCYRLSKNYNPLDDEDLPVWAKADLLLNIGTYRLNGFKIAPRKYATPAVSGEDLQGIRKAILAGLGFMPLV